MNNILFRFSIALTTFLLGVAVFNGFYWIQINSESFKLNTVQTVINKQFIVTPPTLVNSETEKSDKNRPKFEEGFFYIMGKKPKAFKEFSYFELELFDYDKNTGERFPIAPKGSVYTKYLYQFTKVLIEKRSISFETEKFKGISYQFTGKLVDKIYEVGDDSVYLEGTLIKFKNDKKVMESKLKFGWTLGC